MARFTARVRVRVRVRVSVVEAAGRLWYSWK